ncbi:hypothetical protein SAMN04515654_12827 [Halanaerobium congolense]|uniref:Uncharacterized protein n=1 Tax=Halanaerobium congolense TaxID=54121 RepID=A0A1G8R351_9FIRM|nr:hypothetical protein [Halanaerobium congolense]SDJ11381.1 hypothetical protein SAMN04515654_12827 [Halanaerobium congolense]SET66108.1 hypothetical protein SAMN04515653_12337 [Halanaerobium congolense]
MKILYITSLFFKKASSASIRNISLVNGLIDNDAEVDVLTLKYPEKVEDSFLKNSLHKNVNVYQDELDFLNNYIKNSSNSNDKFKFNLFNKMKNMLKKIIKNIYFFPGVDKEWINGHSKELDYSDYDLIISSSDTKTSHFVAKKIINKMEKEVNWFQIWGDPWTEDINNNYYLDFRTKKAEKNLLKRADIVFYVSLPTLKKMTRTYEKYSDKFRYLSRSFFKEVSNNINSCDKYVFAYTGVLDYGRNLNPLISKIIDYNETKNKKIELQIYGRINKKTNQKLIKSKYVKKNGVVTYKKIINVYKNSHVLIFLSNPESSHQIPGKLFDYFGTNKTILALVENKNDGVYNFLKESNRCLIYKNNFESINLKNVIESIGNEKVLNKYSGETVAKKIINTFEEK